MASRILPDERNDRPVPAPGPNTGGMGSVGQQPDEPSLEEKLGVGKHAPGTPGFHEPTPEEQHRPEGGAAPVNPGSLQLDEDTPGRVNTGTGDQPGNTGGSRTGTPPQAQPYIMDRPAVQVYSDSGSTWW